ncbi:hypothetical protein [Pseudomonas sp. UMAB-40]|uniref:hypothetical protein n=1 Tax=Pseudomonas sp. UMAB-40 TaxID=1365407 RepID=UPI001C56C561|nr:hypothetical protein [Pseudomonas sp. UMAB-40]
MNKNVSALATRLCGHSALTSFSTYRSERSRDALYASASLCGQCRIDIRELVAPRDKGFHRLALPAMVGVTQKQISYANTLRIKAIRQFGPVMAHLALSDAPYAKHALAAYEMLFKITRAAFWTEHTKFPFDSAWVTSEIESLMQKRVTPGNPPSANSAFKYWLEVNPKVIVEARANLPEALPEHPPLPPAAPEMSAQA